MMATRQNGHQNALSKSGMVTSPHWRATEAGAAVLRRGGNAIEALVAAGAALSVLYPHFCGLGGDAVWMISDATGNVETFTGIGQAPQKTVEKPIPVRGPASTATTACLVDSWGRVLDHSACEWSGRESLSCLLEDAIDLAENGFEVSGSHKFWYRFRQSELNDWPGFAETFCADGTQRQTALARTLRQIADHGPRTFYEGELARRISKGLADVGSPLTADDLAATSTCRQRPVSLDYRGLTLYAPPPPTQGVTTLAIMGVLQHLPMSAFKNTGARFYHHLVEAVKQAFLDRHLIGDIDSAIFDIAGHLLNRDRLAIKAQAIDSNLALAWPQMYRNGDTALLAAVDSNGRCASLLQSIYFDWGSGVVVGDTGILWQNRGSAFSFDPNSHNCIQPGKRPFYTLNPGLALRNNRPHLLYGTQGADGQPQTLALLLSLLIDHGLDPYAALSRPRFLLGRTFSDSRDSLKIEANFDDSEIAALADLGHQVSSIEAFSHLGGHAGIIRIQADGTIEGAHDPRSDGGAIGV